MSGIPTPVSLSVLVSTNNGTNYSIQPVSLSGEGITTNVASGSNFHIVWNAGIDFSNKLCWTTRVKLSATLGGSSSQAVSPIFALDTRSGATGVLIGAILDSKLNHPLTNAAVRLENMPFGTNTLNGGTFRLSSIPVGNGYVLDISAAGYASKRLTSVNVPVGTNNLGNIILTNVSGPYRLVPLVPDINPPVTTVEQGGTAYRYYVVMNSSNTPQGGIIVSGQVVGGSAIVQTNDISDYWPGRIAGISDPMNGVVRISITNSVLNQNGSVQTVQLSISNMVQQTFQAQVLPRQYDQVWKQKLGGGAGIGEVLQVKAETSSESDLSHTIANGSVINETISRIREDTIKAGVGVSVGSSLVAKFEAGAGISVGATLTSEFEFDPNTTDPRQNALKLYVDLGNLISGIPGPVQAFYDFVDSTIEPSFEGTNLKSVEGDVQAGIYSEGEGTLKLGIGNGKTQVGVGIEAGFSTDADAIKGYGESFGSVNESALISGVEASASADVSVFAGIQGPKQPDDARNKLGLSYSVLNWGLDAQQLVKSWTLQGQSNPYRIEQINEVSVQSTYPNPSIIWQRYDPPSLFSDHSREFTETLNTKNGDLITAYEWSIYVEQQSSSLGFDLDLSGISFNVDGEMSQGAEAVNERGAILRASYWPLESYPAITNDFFPAQSWSSILGQWGNYAAGPIVQGINQAITVVKNVGNTIVNAGNATLNIVGGALTPGAKVVSSWVSDLFSGNNLVVPHGIQPKGSSSGSSYLPPDGSSNYVYGIDGIYQFSSTNVFSGTATLVIPYNSADVVGLNPADLRIYQLPVGTNRWQLVGGIVDTVSNTVTATITNLGTFAIAPLLPTGDLQLLSSTNALPADGVSTMTVSITNILLNTSNVATQQWLFTATVVGAQLLNPDCDTNLPGTQVMSTNGAITLFLQAPSGGTLARISLASVAGDAYGTAAVNLIDTTPPATPANVSVTAGQSRIWVSWRTNSETDLAGYRVYYNPFTAGPPWNGTAAIEGTPSPVQVTGTNCLLRGLSLGTNYYIAVSAIDSSGNESPLSTPVHITTIQSAPTPPTGVTARFGNDGTNLLMWALSEDDGYNDRDVTQYNILRAILPGGSYVKIGQVTAGIGIFSTTNTPVTSTQTVSYAVSVADNSSLTSTQTVVSVIPPTSMSINAPQILNGRFQLSLTNGVLSQSYILWSSTNLINWTPVVTNVYTNSSMIFFDPKSTNFNQRFYRIGY